MITTLELKDCMNRRSLRKIVKKFIYMGKTVEAILMILNLLTKSNLGADILYFLHSDTWSFGMSGAA